MSADVGVNMMFSALYIVGDQEAEGEYEGQDAPASPAPDVFRSGTEEVALGQFDDGGPVGQQATPVHPVLVRQLGDGDDEGAGVLPRLYLVHIKSALVFK